MTVFFMPSKTRRAGAAGRLRPNGVGRRISRAITAVTTALLLAFSLSGVNSTAAVAATQSRPKCPDVLLIGARGSGETDQRSAGLGPEVQTLYKQLETDLKGKLSVQSLSVNYTAAAVDVLKPTAIEIKAIGAALLLAPGAAVVEIAAAKEVYKVRHLDPFLSSIDEGLTSAMQELSIRAALCPSTRFVLAGFSQGAMVMHQLLLRLTDTPNSALFQRVAASALIADGDRVKGTSALSYWSSKTAPAAEGIESFFLNGGRDIPMQPPTYNICNAGDIVCDFSFPATVINRTKAIDIHLSYVNTQLVKGVGTSIAKQLLATVLGRRDHLVISPETATILLSESQTYTAEGFDNSNKSKGDVTASTTFSISPDGSCAGAVCTASQPGVHTVTGRNSSKLSYATLNVQPAPVLDHVVLSPPSRSIAAGGSQTYTAAGFDASNASLGDITGSTTFSIAPDGSCTAAVCTASTPGAHTVTGTIQGKNGTATLTVEPNQPAAGLSSVQRVAEGPDATSALRTDGTVWAWGYNGSGQLGNGTTTSSAVPLKVTGLTGVQDITETGDATFALKVDGTVWAWGSNFAGELGNGTTADSAVPVQVSGLRNVQSIADTDNAGFAVKTDGTVWAWGANFNGQLGNGTTTDSAVPVQVNGLTGVQQITAKDGSVFALKTDGTVWAWGSNGSGQLGIGTTTDSATPVQVRGLTGVKSVTAAGSFSLALKLDGTVATWGYNFDGELGNGTTTNSAIPVQVSGLGGVESISAASFGPIVLKTDGTVWDWGYNHFGGLGNGTTTNSAIPVQVSGLAGVQKIDGGRNSGFAIRDDGTVWGWGQNNGLFGSATTADSSVPVQILGLANVRYLNVDTFGFAVKSDGTLWAWGYNVDGRLGIGAGTTNTFVSVPVQVQ